MRTLAINLGGGAVILATAIAGVFILSGRSPRTPLADAGRGKEVWAYKSAPGDSIESDDAPITEADCRPPFKQFREPLKLGDVGTPWTMEVVNVIDADHAITKMWFGSANGSITDASEFVLATVPTRGLVSDHGYFFTSAGAVAAAPRVEPTGLQAFKVVGTKTFRGYSHSTTVFVVKPVP